MTTRRLFLLRAASLIAAPAVIRTAGLLMLIKPLRDYYPIVEWMKKRNLPPMMLTADGTFDLPYAIETGVISYTGRDLSFAGPIVARDWPSRSIEAQPSGFKIARG